MQTPFYRTDRPFLFSSTPAHHLYNNSPTRLPAIKHTIKAPAHQSWIIIEWTFFPANQHTIKAPAHQYMKLPLCIFTHPPAHHWKLSTPMFQWSSLSFLPSHQHTIEASAHQSLNLSLYLFCPPISTPSMLQHTNVWFFLYIFFARPPAHHWVFSTPMFKSSYISSLPTHQHTIKASAHQS